MESKRGKWLRKTGRRQLREWRRHVERFLLQHPQTRRQVHPIEAHLEPRSSLHQPADMRVEVLWRENGEVRRKLLPWQTRPATREALAEWIENYLDQVADGYKPDGHASPPMPHCARITLNGRVMAEWMNRK